MQTLVCIPRQATAPYCQTLGPRTKSPLHPVWSSRHPSGRVGIPRHPASSRVTSRRGRGRRPPRRRCGPAPAGLRRARGTGARRHTGALQGRQGRVGCPWVAERGPREPRGWANLLPGLPQPGRIAGQEHLGTVGGDQQTGVAGRVPRQRYSEQAAVTEQVVPHPSPGMPTADASSMACCRASKSGGSRSWRKPCRIASTPVCSRKSATVLAKTLIRAFGKSRSPAMWSPWKWETTTRVTSCGVSPRACSRAGRLSCASSVTGSSARYSRAGSLRVASKKCCA
jgi:hypothetical protein